VLTKPPPTLGSQPTTVDVQLRRYACQRECGQSDARDAERPQSRQRGYALALDEKMRTLIVEIRRAYPGASVPLIMRTLIGKGHLRAGAVQASALRRLLAEHGLDRRTLARTGSRERRRWVTDRPGRVWHADVCHGPPRAHGKMTRPLRIHGIHDDASRYLPGLKAMSSEREVDMIELPLGALREHGRPDTLYLDNGSTYVGEALALVCGRLGIAVMHARPYDPQARSKMERFWRTLRELLAGILEADQRAEGERSTSPLDPVAV